MLGALYVHVTITERSYIVWTPNGFRVFGTKSTSTSTWYCHSHFSSNFRTTFGPARLLIAPMLFPVCYLLLPLLMLSLTSAKPYCTPIDFHDPKFPKRAPFSAADCAFLISHFPDNGYLRADQLRRTVGQRPAPLRLPSRLAHRSCEITIVINDELQPDYPIERAGSDWKPELWSKAKETAQAIYSTCQPRAMGGIELLRLNAPGDPTVIMRVSVHTWDVWGGETYWI